MKCAQIFSLILLILVLSKDGSCENETSELIEEGRTFVHHHIKRLAIILPAIFFKLGIAFSLLLLVTIVAVNNGFIGFLLLIVGVSSVLARLQEAKRILPVPIPGLHSPIPLGLSHHQHFLDRSDDVGVKEARINNPTTNLPYVTYSNLDNNNYVYNGKYYTTQ
ncbi:protein apnoia [Onthophagus taurus]|uniref:protein apnoia n=1 Tax=Onthophagus taurus TaxID=166361 RepID=UPI0039BE211C